MSNPRHDFIKALALAATFALVGCGPVAEQEETAAPELEAVEQNSDSSQFGVEDLIGGLDRVDGLLYAESSSVDVTLQQLAAQRQADGSYLTTDALTGEQTRFFVRPIAYADWLRFWKRCPNGQWVPSWFTCPTVVYEDRFIRVWQNASCNWKVQSASWSACFPSGTGGSYRFQYYEAWKCGVGKGFCVERRAVRTVRYDYALAACNPSLITGITPRYDFLCKP